MSGRTPLVPPRRFLSWLATTAPLIPLSKGLLTGASLAGASGGRRATGGVVLEVVVGLVAVVGLEVGLAVVAGLAVVVGLVRGDLVMASGLHLPATINIHNDLSRSAFGYFTTTAC